MSEDLHDLSRVDVEVDEQGSAGAAAVMHGDFSYSCLAAAGIPGAVEVAGFDGGAPACGDDPSALVPGDVGGLSCCVLFDFSLTKCANADVGQWEDRVVRAAGFGFPVEKLTADALKLVAQGQFCGVEVDIIPGQVLQDLVLAVEPEPEVESEEVDRSI